MPEYEGQHYDDRYTLIAKLGNRRKSAVIYGSAHAVPKELAGDRTAQEIADFDVTVGASIKVMGLAENDEVWAKGHIRLMQKGRCLQEMEAKR